MGVGPSRRCTTVYGIKICAGQELIVLRSSQRFLISKQNSKDFGTVIDHDYEKNITCTGQVTHSCFTDIYPRTKPRSTVHSLASNFLIASKRAMRSSTLTDDSCNCVYKR